MRQSHQFVSEFYSINTGNYYEGVAYAEPCIIFHVVTSMEAFQVSKGLRLPLCIWSETLMYLEITPTVVPFS
jgi:hypothetical protein